jgi:hypothetical protein
VNKRWLGTAVVSTAAIAVFSTGSASAQTGPAAASSAAPASAGWMPAGANECISSQAKSVLNQCPGGPGLKRGAPAKRGAVFLEETQKVKEKKKDLDKPKDDLKAERPSPTMSNKIETALMQEIVLSEQQLAKTKVSDPKHVTLSRRLAESYYELERMKEGEALQLTTDIVLAEKAKKPTDEMKKKRDKANMLRDKSQERVVTLYRYIVDKHTDYAKNDEVLYYLAYEYESQKATDPNDKAQLKRERESKEKALATYLELVKKYPQSKYVSAAYIAFGDLYFEEALNGRAEWTIPLEAYDRVIKAGEPPENKQWMYAQYKKGFAYWNLGQYKDAVTSFKSAIDKAQKFPSVPKAEKIAEEARRELIPVYAEYGKAEEAYGFFQQVNGGSKDKTIVSLEKLGEEYLARAHPSEAKKLFTELKGHNPANACFYETRITEATINMNPKDKSAIKAQLANLTRTFDSYRSGANPDDKKQACGNQTAWLLSEHAIAWEYEALGDLGCPPDKDKLEKNPKLRPGTCNKDALASSIDVFKLILGTFKTFEGYKFNVKNPEDAPSIPKIKYAYADLLYGQQRWSECGPAFDDVVAMDPNGPTAGEAAFASVLCYDQEYNQKYKEKEKKEGSGKGSIAGSKGVAEASVKAKNAPMPLDAYQSKMIGAFDRFVCYIKPDPGAKTYAEDLEKLVEIKHQRAFMYFDAKHWDEAAEAFRDIAVNYPDGESGVRDAEMYMEALARIYMYAEPSRSGCGNYMGAEVEKMIDIYCDEPKVSARLKGDKTKTKEFLGASANLCDRLHSSKADLDAIKANDLAKQEKFEEAGDRFVKLSDDVCSGAMAKSEADARATAVASKKPVPKEEASACETRGDIYLYNAALNYQRASKIKRAMDLRENKILGHKSWKTRETYRMTLFDLAEDYRRIALYGKAADYYEQYAATEANIPNLLELAMDKVDKERAAHPDKYTGKKNEDVAKEYVEEQRASALSNAVVLRLGLGQEEEAIKNSNVFDRQFGAKRKDQARQIFLAIGEHYIVREEWVKGSERLDKFIKNYPDARLDEKLHVRAMLGRAYRALKQTPAADTQYGAIRADWKDGREKLFEQIETAAKSNPNMSKIRENAYSAVAEAYIYFADKDYVKANEVKFPAYSGNGDLMDIQKYFQTKFVAYLKERNELNQKAYEGYVRVICLGEDIDPAKGCTKDWKERAELFASRIVVESSSKAGELYADMYDKARNAPLSNDMTVFPGDDAKFVTEAEYEGGPIVKRSIADKKKDNIAMYKSKFDIAAEPVKSKAKAAFVECLTVSTKAKFFDSYSERCERWLSANFKNEYRRMEELRPTGGLVGSGLKDRAFLVDSKLIPFDVSTRK